MTLAELEASIGQSAIAFVITDPRSGDNPIVAANGAFCELTGYRLDEVVGRNPRFLQGVNSEEEARAVIREAVRLYRCAITQMTNYRRDGSSFVNAMVVTPIFDGKPAPAFFLGSQYELGTMPITALESRRRSAAEAIATLSPRQLDVLRELARGYRGNEIAVRLNLSQSTVKMHRALMVKKLAVRSVAEAVRLAAESGIPL